MDYALDEQQTDVRQLADDIFTRCVTPSRLTDLETAGDWFDADLWRELATAGLVGIAIAEESGGSGAGFVELCLVIEAAARAAAAVFLVESSVAALAISGFGTDTAKSALLAPYCAGELLLSSAVAVDAGWRSGLRARNVDGAWQLSGDLSHVPLLDRSARVLVTATDDASNEGLFLLDPRAPGVTFSAQSSIDRKPRWYLAVANAAVAGADVLVAPSVSGADAVTQIRDWMILARCITQLGHSEAALATTAAYVSDRRQFGKPIGSFQAVAHRTADAYIDVLGIRLTTWRAAWLIDQGIPDDEATSIAAWWASDAATRVGEAAMHLHGGAGVDMDYPLHRHYLAVKQGELALGGSSRRMAALGGLIGA
jgi:3-oxocholest-4-en-26-oyl-CoA dehydrogenase beta subunit